MAVEATINVEGDVNALYIFDNTGKYSNPSNLTGWGIPNLELSDIQTSVLSIWQPNLDPATDLSIDIDVFPYIPNDEGKGFEILASDMGLEDIESGVWNFKLISTPLVGDAVETEFVAYTDGKIRCCIATGKIKITPCNIDSDCAKKAVELETLMDNANWAACEGDYVTAQSLATYINLQCECCI